MRFHYLEKYIHSCYIPQQKKAHYPNDGSWGRYEDTKNEEGALLFQEVVLLPGSIIIN